MSFMVPAFRAIQITHLTARIDELKAELSHKNLFLERYVKLLARMHVQSLNAVASDTIRIRNEGMAARIEEIEHEIMHKTRMLHLLEDRMAMILEGNSWVRLH